MPRIVITGANRGIGGALSALLTAHAGYEVISGSRDAKVPLDLASFASVDAFVASLRGRPVDVLVNNAGAMFAEHGLTQDGVERSLAVNCTGPLRLTEKLTPKRVVNVVTSPLGKVDLGDLNLTRRYACFGAYLASKMAFMHVVRTWAAEGRAVHSVHPGMVRTPMLKAPAGPMRYLAPLLHPFADPPEKPAKVLASIVTSRETPSDALFAGGRLAKWSARLGDAAKNAQVTAEVRRLALR